MTKERKAQIITVLVLAAAAGIAVARKGVDLSQWAPRAAAPKADPTPQDAIYAMLDAAREGKVSEYLAAHTGQMEQSLRKAVAEAVDRRQRSSSG